MSAPPPPEAVLLIEIQASGKSSFTRERSDYDRFVGSLLTDGSPQSWGSP